MFYGLGKASRFFHFFFNDAATTEIYPLSLRDALPICTRGVQRDGVTGLRNDLRVGRADYNRFVGAAVADRGVEGVAAVEIGRAHVGTPLTLEYLKPPSA